MDQSPPTLTGQLLPAPAAAVAGELIPAGDDPLGLYARDWQCMVCGAVRIYDDIHTAGRPIPGMEDMFRPVDGDPRGFARVNVRYCRDRGTCAAVATATTPWPPDAPVLQAGNEVRLSAAGALDRIWTVRDERVGTDVARIVLQHLRARSATLRELVDAHSSQAPDLMFDTVRRLVQIGAVDVGDPAIEAAA